MTGNHRADSQEKESNSLSRKIDSVTNSCSKNYFNKILKELAKASYENANIICEFIIAEETEINIKNSTKETKIKVLVWLSNFHENTKSFRILDKQDILEYLNNSRKATTDDPSQRWIGSYNNRQIILNKFFRWLYNPTEPNHKLRNTPTCMTGIKQLQKKQITPYSPSDLWESREHAIFLKYCPSVRDRCYHALANDMSARPHEILNIKIKDINFKLAEEGQQYAEVIIKGGKTMPRTVPLIDSLPYVKDLISQYSSGTNPDSWLFVSNSNSSLGSKLTYDGLYYQYKYFYKTEFFPSLLEKDTVPEADKSLIRNMLTKPWNLYIFRHSGLTQKSMILKEHVLRNYAGWTMSSKMPQVYIHYYGNESSKALLRARGILNENTDEKSNFLKVRPCPNCTEPNKTDSQFCRNCRHVLSIKSYHELINREREKDSEIKGLKEQINKMEEKDIKDTLGFHKKYDDIQKELHNIVQKFMT